MRLDAPEWLILIPCLIFIGWYWRDLHLQRPLRVTLLLLIIAVLTNPQWQMLKPGVSLSVLVDRSDSAQEPLTPHLKEWEELLKTSQGPHDTLRFIDYAAQASERSGGETALFPGETHATSTSLALNAAMSLGDANREQRVLILSDGFTTEPLKEVKTKLVESGVSVYHRLINPNLENDYQITNFNLRTRSQVKEPFMIEFEVTGPAQGQASYSIMRNDQKIGEGTTQLVNGSARIRLSDRIHQSGAYRYSISINAAEDKRIGNNTAERWIEIMGSPKIVLITAYAPDPVALALQSSGFNVEVITDYGTLHSGRISQSKAVILNNVPAHKLPEDFLEALDFYVRSQGGGLVMLGGNHSFGAGGYFGSEIADVLPISMELKEEHRKLSVAMAIVLDRSGSMGMTVAGGQTKMELASAGAAGTIRLLGQQDMATIYAVDSKAHQIVPLTSLAAEGDRNAVYQRARRIVSMGGGIFVYNGLKAAWDELQKAERGQRHVILFSDAADSEQPGEYKNLLKEMTDQGATVSVIALGRESDPDADFLKDIALRGRGRMFFNTDANDLPRLFAQETVSVARSAFIEETVAIQTTAGWLEISPKPLQDLKQTDGYNLSYLKPNATSAAYSLDDYQSPLIAYWQRGAGRAAAVSLPLAGKGSAAIRQWSGYGDFIQTLARWLMGEDAPPGIGLKTAIKGNRFYADLFYDEKLETEMQRNFPEFILTNRGYAERETLQWERLSPGHLRVSTSFEFGSPYRGVVQVGKHPLPFGPYLAGKNIEWLQNANSVREVEQLAHETGGEELLNFAHIWQAEESKRYASLRLPLMILAVLIALSEFAWSRFKK